MRITFVLPVASLEGGVRVVAEYARQLQERGHDVEVVSLGRYPSKPLWSRTKSRIKALLAGRLSEAVAATPVRKAGPSHVDELGPLHRRLPHAGPVRDIDVADADVVIATWWQTVPWVAALSASKGKKVHFIQHDERVMMATPEAKAEAGDVTWKTPDFSRVTVASWITDVGRREYDADSTVVSNAVSQTLFNAPPRPQGRPATVGFMDSRVSFKGADVAAAAVELARERLPDLRVVCFGANERSDGHAPSWASYHHRPPQETIADVYRSCDAWLFASRCEGFGLPILEAMACRTPVIGTPAGAGPDLINSDNGRLVPMNDPKSMAEAIVEVVSLSPDDWQEMSHAAHETASRHSWSAATDEFEGFLRSAAGE